MKYKSGSMLLSKIPCDNHCIDNNIKLHCQYYNTEKFSPILIIVTLNITIYNSIVILPSPTQDYENRSACAIQAM